ncbi:hypothetical protein ACWEQ0_28530, partial [Nocardia thailandica]
GRGTAGRRHGATGEARAHKPAGTGGSGHTRGAAKSAAPRDTPKPARRRAGRPAAPATRRNPAAN